MDKRKRKDKDVEGYGYRTKANGPRCSSQEIPMINEKKEHKHQQSRVAQRPIASLKIRDEWFNFVVPIEQVLEENKSILLATPAPLLESEENVSITDFCAYHLALGHSTNQCWKLCFLIRRVFVEGKLKGYLLPQLKDSRQSEY